jgi:hypothetical protein
MQGRYKNIVELTKVAHACNPSNSGGGDQEDHDLKVAQANSLQELTLKKKKKTNTKKC